MTTYIIRRLLWLIPVLLTVSAVTFVVMRSAPGGPWDTDAERRQVDAATAKSLAAYYGLDKPMWRQFYAYVIGDTNSQTKEWVCGVICGNLGPSYRQRGRTVQNILFSPPEGKSFWQSRFGYSVRLGVLALSMAIFVGIPLGIIAALKQNTIVDYTALFIATSGISVPSFVLAIFLIIIFASRLHWIDIVVDDWTQIKYWLMPMAVLGFGTLAYTARLTRSSMLEVMRQDYVRTARAKGLAERIVIFIHMLKNALIPVITILGPALAGLVTGSFIIETMFSFPGMGRAYVQAIGQRDYSMIMGTTLIYALLVAVANLSVDIVYVFIDPRIRLEE
ncbi:MAG: Dipeptide transport system permease protein DppB [Anaerolineales bacterium]|nr:ABC transporter permease [Anaerolineae bacterium]MBL8104754.1 ABC transporter permease [Anaerolineales bacterium]MBV6401379.1 Dipeptide transport system permease protein DppB [Anaerolineales bacterium]MCC7187218.1 ABC transporter permease [Anaerolineales bacterium]